MTASTDTITLLGISGSLRSDSLNTALLAQAADLLPDTVSYQQLEYADVPVYNGDLDGETQPDPVQRVRQLAHEADAFLIATPEYNQTIPGSIKNLFDWLSRKSSQTPNVFSGKPIAIIGATPGMSGTRAAQAHWLPLVHALSLDLYSQHKMMLARYRTLIDDGGALIPEFAGQLSTFIDGYIDFVTHRARQAVEA